jgi:hypothetical protein
MSAFNFLAIEMANLAVNMQEIISSSQSYVQTQVMTTTDRSNASPRHSCLA